MDDGSTVTTRAALRYVVSAEGMEPYWSLIHADSVRRAEKRRKSEGVSCTYSRFRTQKCACQKNATIPRRRIAIYFYDEFVTTIDAPLDILLEKH
jgi:hypothetical protein